MFPERRIIRQMHLQTKDLIARSEVVPLGWCDDPMTLRVRVGLRCRKVVRATTAHQVALLQR